jgi:hypothetical protein
LEDSRIRTGVLPSHPVPGLDDDADTPLGGVPVAIS